MGNADVVGDIHRLIAFDLDGTLIDSRRDLADSANQLITELGGMQLPEASIGAMVGEGAAMLVRRALAAAGLQNSPDALARFLTIYEGRLLNHTRPYPRVAAAVELARRHACVAVLTNKPARHTERILEGLGWRALFDEVVGGDGPLPRKPDPASLLALMERARASASHTLLVGDSAIDHETAVRASVPFCLVSWGFADVALLRARLTGREWIAADPRELHDVVARFACAAAK